MADPIVTEPTEKLVTVNLDVAVSINDVKYPEGAQEVPEWIAEDLVRINYNHNKYLLGLNKNSPSNGNGGSVSAA